MATQQDQQHQQQVAITGRDQQQHQHRRRIVIRTVGKNQQTQQLFGPVGTPNAEEACVPAKVQVIVTGNTAIYFTQAAS